MIRDLSDPAGSNTLLAAVQWIQGTMLGSVATTVAVISIAWVGFEMLAGRVPLQRGATVLAGCFILFGAPTIVAGLMSMGAGSAAPPVAAVETSPLAHLPVAPANPQGNYDPYAGASVPIR